MKRILLWSILLVGTCVALASAAWADPPPWAPAHGWRAKHHYTYYPRGEVYYAPESRTWFWLDGGNWRSGIRLPLAFQAYIRTGGINIELGTDRPWVDHRYVVEHYGGERPREYRGRDDHDRGERRRHEHGRQHDENDDGD
jgi:hypothetical protein